MIRRIVISAEAATHLETDVEYLSEVATIDVAIRFQGAIATELERLCEFPELGSPRPGTNPRLQGLRMRPIEGFPNWLIYYLLRERTIEVLWVLHVAEDRDRIVSERLQAYAA